MKPGVPGQFRMKGGDQTAVLAGRNGADLRELGQHLNVFAGLCQTRGPNEHAVERAVFPIR